MAIVIAYIDSSVLLRVILQQSDRLQEWDSLHRGVSSRLIDVEVRRTLDRLWLQHELSDEELARTIDSANALLDRIEHTEIDLRALNLASQPMPTVLGTLDAIHLASAILYRQAQSDEGSIAFATHDRALARAARAMSFDVLGA
jgi:predicted nucleic acid-binding protein